MILLKHIKQTNLDKRLIEFLHYSYINCVSNISLSNQQCAAFGLSSRQLRRLTHRYLGMSPKEFTNVIRFQNTLQLISKHQDKNNHQSLFYDQSHFIKQFKHHSGLTPDKFIKMSVLYNTDKKS